LVGLEEPLLSDLPRGVVKFHVIGGRAIGRMKVTRGSKIIQKWLATLGGLPRDNPSATVDVTVRNNEWFRQFDGKHLKSKWSLKNGLVLEDFGLFQFGFHLKPFTKSGVTKGFHHVTKRMYILGIPIPRFLGLVADGITRVSESGDGWFVDVEVSSPIFGLLVSYQGHVQLCQDS